MIYEQLRLVASSRMARERQDHTLGATALVHEAYLRLIKGDVHWKSRRHFFAAAAECMRRILIDHARSRNAIKHGGEAERVAVALDHIPGLQIDDDQLLDLDEAIQQLAIEHPKKAQLVTLRYFAGLKIREAAEVLDVSTATADRYWNYARAWLQTKLTDDSA
ncbi:MAG: ECF-type sigma factor [Planctomycetota bacterium]